MMKICQSLAAEMKEVAKKRKEIVNQQKAFRKEGWVLLKPSEILVLKTADREAETVPLHLIKSSHTNDFFPTTSLWVFWKGDLRRGLQVLQF
eukprot:1011041-Ditylum_brightwellii.AAC.1